MVQCLQVDIQDRQPGNIANSNEQALPVDCSLSRLCSTAETCAAPAARKASALLSELPFAAQHSVPSVLTTSPGSPQSLEAKYCGAPVSSVLEGRSPCSGMGCQDEASSRHLLDHVLSTVTTNNACQLDSAVVLVLMAAVAATAQPKERAAAGPIPWPAYFISTRDCFTHDLQAVSTQVWSIGTPRH